jgi:hypothetical protein
METIYVYQLISPGTIYRHAERLESILQSVAEIAKDEMSFQISAYGELSFARLENPPVSDEPALADQAAAEICCNRFLTGLAHGVSTDSSLQEAGLRELFGKPYVESATATGEQDHVSRWDFVLGLALYTKPRGILARTVNASITLTIDGDERLLSLGLTWRPIAKKVRTTQFPLFVGLDSTSEAALAAFSDDFNSERNGDRVTIEYVYAPSECLVVPVYTYDGDDRSARMPASTHSFNDYVG